MKKGIILLLIAVNAAACTAPEKPEEMATCDMYGGVAASTMSARQAGVSLSDMMKTSDSQSPGLSEISRHMIIEAYDEPEYSSELVKQRVIADFRDRWHLRCLKDTK